MKRGKVIKMIKVIIHPSMIILITFPCHGDSSV